MVVGTEAELGANDGQVVLGLVGAGVLAFAPLGDVFLITLSHQNYH